MAAKWLENDGSFVRKFPRLNVVYVPNEAKTTLGYFSYLFFILVDTPKPYSRIAEAAHSSFVNIYCYILVCLCLLPGALDLYYRQAAAALSQRVSPTALQQQQQQQPPRGGVFPSSAGTGPAGAMSLSLPLPESNNSPGQRSSTSSSLLSNSAAGATVAANANSNLSRPSSVEKT